MESSALYQARTPAAASDMRVDSDAIREIYQLHNAELRQYLVLKHRLNMADAEDIVQQVFARFADTADAQLPDNPRAYLYKMVSNAAIDRGRRLQVQTRFAELESAQEPDAAQGPEQLVEQRQRLGLLARILWGMPKKRRQLLLMSRFDGLSFAEISRRVGLSESVVRKHINNALADCHKAMSNDAGAGVNQ